MSPAQIASILDENQSLRDEVADLTSQLEWFRRQVFGTKSERFVAPDCQTTLELAVEPAQAAAQTQRISYERTRPAKQTPHGREEIPAHLPRKEFELLPPDDISGMERIGQKVTEQLEYLPAQMFVTRYVRPVFAGDVDGVRKVVCAELPPLCSDKGKFGPSMVAHVTVAKYEDHTPVHRQRKQILRDSGVDVAESSLDKLPEIAATWLDIIARRCREEVLASGYAQMDESHIQVMIKPTNGKSTTGQMWLMHSPEKRIVVFDYDRHRSAEVARRLLKGYEGILQTDGYVVYNAYNKAPGIVHAGCHAHARRGFDESLGNDKVLATHVLCEYRKLFDIEELARQAAMTPEQRLALRLEKTAPIMAELKAWLDTQLRKVQPRGPIGTAIRYTLNQWTQLTRCLEDGRIELSNNFVENCVRPLALGRKNWLFAGCEDAARRAATIYTVLNTCRLHGVNSFEYLTDVLQKLPTRKASDIDDLLPWNWVASQK